MKILRAVFDSLVSRPTAEPSESADSTTTSTTGLEASPSNSTIMNNNSHLDIDTDDHRPASTSSPTFEPAPGLTRTSIVSHMHSSTVSTRFGSPVIQFGTIDRLPAVASYSSLKPTANAFIPSARPIAPFNPAPGSGRRTNSTLSTLNLTSPYYSYAESVGVTRSVSRPPSTRCTTLTLDTECAQSSRIETSVGEIKTTTNAEGRRESSSGSSLDASLSDFDGLSSVPTTPARLEAPKGSVEVVDVAGPMCLQAGIYATAAIAAPQARPADSSRSLSGAFRGLVSPDDFQSVNRTPIPFRHSTPPGTRHVQCDEPYSIYGDFDTSLDLDEDLNPIGITTASPSFVGLNPNAPAFQLNVEPPPAQTTALIPESGTLSDMNISFDDLPMEMKVSVTRVLGRTELVAPLHAMSAWNRVRSPLKDATWWTTVTGERCVMFTSVQQPIAV